MGHIEDLVVAAECRGLQLGKRLGGGWGGLVSRLEDEKEEVRGEVGRCGGKYNVGAVLVGRPLLFSAIAWLLLGEMVVCVPGGFCHTL